MIDNVYQFKILLLKAEILGEENDPASCSAASGIYKELTNYKGLTPGLRIDLLMKTGDLNFNRHEWQHALENYNNAETYLVNNTSTGNKEWILFRKISIYYNINRPAEAQKNLAELRKINPNSFWIQQAEKMRRNNIE
jgi:tetratricopeptide (TPR) repeat protein